MNCIFLICCLCQSLVNEQIQEKINDDFSNLIVCQDAYYNNELNNTNDDSEISFDLPISMYDYFYNLGNYQADNLGGSCGYVALISLLSYYDTILNDNIISENYNFHKENITNLNDTLYNSPGVTNEKFENIESTMIENGYVNPTYSDYIDYSYDYNFQSFLIKESNSIISKTPDSGELYSRGLGLWDYKVLLEHLYPNIEISTFEDYVHQNLNENLDDPVIQQRFINEIKQSVDDNIPIIVHIKGYDGIDELHHAVVVYDYDDKHIYANFGYGPGFTHLPIFEYDALGNIISDYNRIYYITQCDFSNFSHVHSDNYVINGVKYCGCGYHEHELTYSSINCFEHIGECPCGYYETGIHIHTDGHNPNCRYCNESYLLYAPTSKEDISGINGLSFGIMAGRYTGDNQNSNIFLNISYEWEGIPTERFVDYIVVYWTYGLNIDDEIADHGYTNYAFILAQK